MYKIDDKGKETLEDSFRTNYTSIALNKLKGKYVIKQIELNSNGALNIGGRNWAEFEEYPDHKVECCVENGIITEAKIITEDGQEIRKTFSVMYKINAEGEEVYDSFYKAYGPESFGKLKGKYTIRGMELPSSGGLTIGSRVWAQLIEYAEYEVEVDIEDSIVMEMRIFKGDGTVIKKPFHLVYRIENDKEILTDSFLGAYSPEAFKKLKGDYVIRRKKLSDKSGVLVIGGKTRVTISKYAGCESDVYICDGIVTKLEIIDEDGNRIEETFSLVYKIDEKEALVDSFLNSYISESFKKLKGRHVVKNIILDNKGILALGGRKWAGFQEYPNHEAECYVEDGIVTEVKIITEDGQKTSKPFSVIYKIDTDGEEKIYDSFYKAYVPKSFSRLKGKYTIKGMKTSNSGSVIIGSRVWAQFTQSPKCKVELSIEDSVVTEVRIVKEGGEVLKKPFHLVYKIDNGEEILVDSFLNAYDPKFFNALKGEYVIRKVRLTYKRGFFSLGNKLNKIIRTTVPFAFPENKGEEIIVYVKDAKIAKITDLDGKELEGKFGAKSLKSPGSKALTKEEHDYIISLLKGAEEKKLGPPHIKFYVLKDLKNRSGIPRFPKAKKAFDHIYAYALRSIDDLALKIYITEDFFEYLKINESLLTEVACHEYDELISRKEHAFASARAHKYVPKGKDLSPFHTFIINQMIKEEDLSLIDLILPERKMPANLLKELKREREKPNKTYLYERKFYSYLISTILRSEVLRKLIKDKKYDIAGGYASKIRTKLEQYKWIRLDGRSEKRKEILSERLHVSEYREAKKIEKTLTKEGVTLKAISRYSPKTVIVGNRLSPEGKLHEKGKARSGKFIIQLKEYAGCKAAFTMENGDIYKMWILDENDNVIDFKQMGQIYEINGAFRKRFYKKINSNEFEGLGDCFIEENRLDSKGNLVIGGKKIEFGRRFSLCKIKIKVTEGIITKVQILDEYDRTLKQVDLVLIYDEKDRLVGSYYDTITKKRLKGFGKVTIRKFKLNSKGGVHIADKKTIVGDEFSGHEAEIKIEAGVIKEVKVFNVDGECLKTAEFALIYARKGGLKGSFYTTLPKKALKKIGNGIIKNFSLDNSGKMHIAKKSIDFGEKYVKHKAEIVIKAGVIERAKLLLPNGKKKICKFYLVYKLKKGGTPGRLIDSFWKRYDPKKLSKMDNCVIKNIILDGKGRLDIKKKRREGERKFLAEFPDHLNEKVMVYIKKGKVFKTTDIKGNELEGIYYNDDGTLDFERSRGANPSEDVLITEGTALKAPYTSSLCIREKEYVKSIVADAIEVIDSKDPNVKEEDDDVVDGNIKENTDNEQSLNYNGFNSNTEGKTIEELINISVSLINRFNVLFNGTKIDQKIFKIKIYAVKVPGNENNDKLGIPRFEGAEKISDHVFSYGEFAEVEGALKIYVTERFLKEHLRRDILLLEEIISHEYMEKVLGYSHSVAASRSYMFKGRAGISPFHWFYINNYIRQSGFSILKDLDIRSVSHDIVETYNSVSQKNNIQKIEVYERRFFAYILTRLIAHLEETGEINDLNKTILWINEKFKKYQGMEYFGEGDNVFIRGRVKDDGQAYLGNININVGERYSGKNIILNRKYKKNKGIWVIDNNRVETIIPQDEEVGGKDDVGSRDTVNRVITQYSEFADSDVVQHSKNRVSMISSLASPMNEGIRHQLAVNVMKEIGGKGSEVLSLGVGSGAFEEILVQKGSSVTGVDITPELLIRAEKRGINTIKANINDPEFWNDLYKSGQKFDAVMFGESLGYFDPYELFEQIKRVIKPGGRIFIFLAEEYEELDPEGMFKLFTITDVEKALLDTGWHFTKDPEEHFSPMILYSPIWHISAGLFNDNENSENDIDSEDCISDISWESFGKIFVVWLKKGWCRYF